MSWSWETGTPRERAEMVRKHASPSARAPSYHDARQLSDDDLCRLFNLTPAGLQAILAGADWRPEHAIKPGAPS